MSSQRLEPNRLKVTLKLAINRLKILKEKSRTENKILRRTVAKELETGKESSAKVKVEKIIREDYYIEALDLLENYCDLLVTRIDLLDSKTECDQSIVGIVTSIIYASTRTPVKELETARDIFTMKFGRDFVKEALDDSNETVDQKLKYKLEINPPEEAFINGYLTEIARGYKVRWGDAFNNNQDDSDGGSGGLGEKKTEPKTPTKEPKQTVSKEEPAESDTSSVKETQSPSDIIKKLPSTPPSKVVRRVAMAQDGTGTEQEPNPKDNPSTEDTPSIDELMSRFEALKKR